MSGQGRIVSGTISLESSRCSVRFKTTEGLLGPTRFCQAALPLTPATQTARLLKTNAVCRVRRPGIDIGAFELQYPTHPFFTSIEVRSQTNLFLRALAFPSTSYTLQASHDFVSWESIATLTTASNGVVQFTSLIAGPKRSFRLKSQTP